MDWDAFYAQCPQVGTWMDEDYLIKEEALRGGRHLIFPGMSKVGNPVALKFFSRPLLFNVELDLLKKIKSPNVIRLLDYMGVEEQEEEERSCLYPPYLVLEYVYYFFDLSSFLLVAFHGIWRKSSKYCMGSRHAMLLE
ncbi:hypothetical protein BJ684DRAFT_18185 [Piptocephalis cylindrospora]|uniref:Protein kinase domain-containing protein n=1 Tax=Piptocephalis cylindrospora TaxID=1907219 RepID=A0A4P9YAF8_9FUNG|nr:hypothetical protein BJ684DRAFT_18185 [Piptocephalis cylindrospora]|eukprot:RKP15481.1 hypothetical protein BJ684DRAFT_18185 [Piptocephalis cylindrospora]